MGGKRLEGNGRKSGAPVLEIEGLGRDYRMGSILVPVLRDVSLQVFPGETVAIVGASGAGKSTLLHIVGGLDRPTAGAVRFRERDLYAMSARQRTVLRARSICFVFQFYHLLPELDVLENVMLPAMNSSVGLLGIYRAAPGDGGGRAPQTGCRQRALALLEAVGLSARAGHLPSELSGGEQQRAALARALVNDPDLILADEPTGNLDQLTGNQVLGILFDLVRSRKRSLLMVTHNADIAGRCDRTVRLADGRLCAS